MKVKPYICVVMALAILLTVGAVQTVCRAEDRYNAAHLQHTVYNVPESSPPVVKELDTTATSAPKFIEPESLLSEEDIELIALVTMGEAEGECEEGQRLIIDTILNRVDSPHFPDTVYDVIWQPNQFSVMWNDRLIRCYVREDICQLVREELESRSNYDVIFFRTEHYSKYGSPLFQLGGHYFSSY